MNIILHIYINCPEKTNVQRQKVEAESGCLKLGSKKQGVAANGYKVSF